MMGYLVLYLHLLTGHRSTLFSGCPVELKVLYWSFLSSPVIFGFRDVCKANDTLLLLKDYIIW